MINSERLIAMINELNENGLELVAVLADYASKNEKYNKNTTPERLAELQQIEKEKEEQRNVLLKADQEKAFLEASKAEHERKKEFKASLTGKEKRFFEIIDSVKIGQSLGITQWQLRLLVETYGNNLIDGSFEIYKYGYLHGQEAEKNRQKKVRIH